MRQRKVPLRSCVITKEKFPKQELIRIVRTPEDKVQVDLTGKINGHGAYIKCDLTVLEKAKKGNALGHYLQCEIPLDVYNELEKIIMNGKERGDKS